MIFSNLSILTEDPPWAKYLLGEFLYYEMSRAIFSCRITVRLRMNVWEIPGA
jgi:hypothetical protein